MAVEQPKVYIEVIKQINEIIYADHLKEGDRLPSERELSDRLDVGRSSVREALRALELLDFIETRRGEGTFIKPVNSYRLVDILLSFLLKDEKAVNDLSETRKIVEIEALKLACERMTDEAIEQLSMYITRAKEEWLHGEWPVEEDYLFHKTIVEGCQNRLLFNIWISLVQYNKVALQKSLQREGRVPIAIDEHDEIYQALQRRDQKAAVDALTKHLMNSRF